MNCLDCEELTQRMLDGESALPELALVEQHLLVCPRCREIHLAARTLLEGLRAQTLPLPPPHLSKKIQESLLVESRHRKRRRALVFTAGMAASVLAVLTASYLSTPRGSGKHSSGLAERRSLSHPATGSPSLTRSVEEAGQAVLTMTRRAATETVDQGRLLLPQTLPETLIAANPELQPLLDQPSASLREIQDGMTAALEPVSSSARRAIDLFLRELQSVEPANKRGS